MKSLFTILMLVVFSTTIAFSQFGLGERLKRKVEEKIEGKTEEAAEKAMEGKNEDEKDDEENSQKKNQDNQSPEKLEAQTLTSYSKFDFIPGDRIIFFEDFSQDNIGDFPAKWNTNGSGEVINTNLIPGKWLKMVEDAIYVPDIPRPFPENFTIEFDVIGSFEMVHDYEVFGYIKSEIFSGENNSGGINYGNEKYSVKSEIEFKFSNTMRAWVRGSNPDIADIANDVDGTWLQNFHSKPIHISISVNKTRYRMWINQSKVFDLPRIISKEAKFEFLRFVAYSINTEKNYNVLLSNIKLAEGTVDTRSKLMTEGKLVTNAITFDTGSENIKPESYPMLKSIAEALTSNPEVNIMIIGHTDNDGNAAKNQTLSEGRALAVKNALVKDFNITESRIKTSGKGALLPIAGNDTSEGKAKNRRVEFVKM